VYLHHPSVEISATAFTLINHQCILKLLKIRVDLLAVDEAGQITTTKALTPRNACFHSALSLLATSDVKQLQTYAGWSDITRTF
jgi:hypothetical protein